MPNTKSAERRMRSSVRRKQNNQSVRNRLKTLEKRFLTLSAAGKKEDAAAALRLMSSALDKAAKTRVIHPNLASRKKSRLTRRLALVKA